MTDYIEQHIISLLKDHDCVVLPGFGGFILKPIHASIHNGTITPPSKEIGFNPGIKTDDGLLTGALMGSKQYTYLVAQNEVGKFANHISYTLKKNKRYTLQGIGNFFLGENDQIKFEPVVTEALDKASYGLPHIAVSPVAKSVIPEVKSSVHKQKDERRKESRKTAKLSLAVVLCLIASVLFLIFSNTQIESINTQQANVVDFLFPGDSTPQPSIDNNRHGKLKSLDGKPLVSRRSQEQAEVIPNLDIFQVSISGKPEGYYQIIGSYVELANAERKEKELFDQGKDSYILKAKNGYYRVGIFHSSSLYEAYSIFKETENAYSGSWMLQNN